MNVSSIQRQVNAADIQIDRLATNQQVSEQEKLGEVSRQFEAVLLRQILSSAQKPVFKSSFNPESTSTAIYRDLVTNQLADSISRSHALGLGDTLASQLGRQLQVNAPPAAAPETASAADPLTATEPSFDY